jgi:hypothetical protein
VRFDWATSENRLRPSRFRPRRGDGGETHTDRDVPVKTPQSGRPSRAKVRLPHFIPEPQQDQPTPSKAKLFNQIIAMPPLS